MEKVLSTMTGNVWKVLVQVGDKVEDEQEVVILESMKMEVPIEVESKGIVKEIMVDEGDFVNEGDILLELEKEN